MKVSWLKGGDILGGFWRGNVQSKYTASKNFKLKLKNKLSF